VSRGTAITRVNWKIPFGTFFFLLISSLSFILTSVWMLFILTLTFLIYFCLRFIYQEKSPNKGSASLNSSSLYKLKPQRSALLLLFTILTCWNFNKFCFFFFLCLYWKVTYLKMLSALLPFFLWCLMCCFSIRSRKRPLRISSLHIVHWVQNTSFYISDLSQALKGTSLFGHKIYPRSTLLISLWTIQSSFELYFFFAFHSQL